MGIAYFFILLYFLPLIFISFVSAFWLLISRTNRLPIKELADYIWCPFRREIQYDMGYVNQLVFQFNKNITFKNLTKAQIKPKKVLDIGSGNGVTSLLYLRELVGPDPSIILSDAVPTVSSWKILSQQDSKCMFISTPVIEHTLADTFISQNMQKKDLVSLFNSLHHLPPESIHSLLQTTSRLGLAVFIMDPKRLSPLQPLIIPFFFLPLYFFLALLGSFRHVPDRFLFSKLLALIVEPWIMCFDQIVGSARRYATQTIIDLAERNHYRVYKDEDMLMQYVLLCRRTRE